MVLDDIDAGRPITKEAVTDLRLLPASLARAVNGMTVNTSRGTKQKKKQAIATVNKALKWEDKLDRLLQMCAVLLFFIVSVVVYHAIEGWGYVDTLYFCVATFTTVGFGDVVPVSWEGKAYTILMGIVGVYFVGEMIGGLIDYFSSLKLKTQSEHISRLSTVRLSMIDKLRSQKINSRAKYAEEENGGEEEDSDTFEMLDNSAAMVYTISFAVFVALIFGTMAAVMAWLEEPHWNAIDAVYHALAVVTTIGYGDVAPKTWEGRLFASLVFIPLALVLTAAAFHAKIEWRLHMAAQTKLDFDTFVRMDKNLDGCVTEADYIKNALEHSGCVGGDTLAIFSEQYRRLDPQNMGFFHVSELTNDLGDRKVSAIGSAQQMRKRAESSSTGSTAKAEEGTVENPASKIYI